MATYKLKKTKQTDMGVPVYEITISFRDQTVVSTVALEDKALAQDYADEFEKITKDK